MCLSFQLSCFCMLTVSFWIYSRLAAVWHPWCSDCVSRSRNWRLWKRSDYFVTHSNAAFEVLLHNSHGIHALPSTPPPPLSWKSTQLYQSQSWPQREAGLGLRAGLYQKVCVSDHSWSVKAICLHQASEYFKGSFPTFCILKTVNCREV